MTDRKQTENQCPVCEMQLPEPVPPFCVQCGWELKNDLTFGIFLDLPDAVIEEYRHRVGIARKHWEARSEAVRRQAELEEKLRKLEAEMNQRMESEEARLRKQAELEEYLGRLEKELRQHRDTENTGQHQMKQQNTALEDRLRQMEAEIRQPRQAENLRLGQRDYNWMAAVLCLVLAGLVIWYFIRPNPPPISVSSGRGSRKDGETSCGSRRFTNSIHQEFVCIEPGTFTMGSPENESGRDSDETQHKVTLTNGFYMQTTEVTQGQWKKIMGSPPPDLYFKDCGDDCPVENVSWEDAQEFMQKLSRKEGKQYRLPTEAEWEYAARAGTSTPFHTGSCLSADQANYNGKYPLEVCPKGKYREKTVCALSEPGFTGFSGLTRIFCAFKSW